MFGEEIRQTFKVLQSKSVVDTPVIPLPESTVKDCPVCCSVLADIADANEFKNDKTSFLFKAMELSTSFVIYLQKKTNGVWGDVATLSNNTYGTFFPLSFIVDESKRKYTGYLINWRLVLTALGEGLYRIRTAEINIFGTVEKFSNDYCLKPYTTHRADGSVKIETYSNNIRGEISDPLDFIDLAETNWYSAFRLCGMFGFDSSEYQDERVEYNNGQQKWITDEQKVKYQLKLKPVNSETHNFIKTDILQADEILITDYNKNNPNTHVQTNVLRDGGYEPTWQVGTKLAGVSIKFISAFNNLRKKRC